MDLACRLCGAATQPFHTQAGRRKYYLCPSCRFILLDPALHPTLAAQKERYLQHQNSPDHPGYVAMFRQFLGDCVTPYVRTGCRALDLGCGPSPVLAGLLKEAGHPTEIYDPIFFPEEPRGTFGLVTCTEVLEHLGDPVAVLRPWVGHLSNGPSPAIGDKPMATNGSSRIEAPSEGKAPKGDPGQAGGQVLVVPSQGADRMGGTKPGSARLEPGGILAGLTLFHPDDPVKFSEWSYPRDFTHVSFYTAHTLEVLAKALGLSLVFTDGKRGFVMKASGEG